MKIEVELFGQLDTTRKGKRSVEVDDRSTARQVADLLNLEPGSIGLVTIDGVQQKLDVPALPGMPAMLFPTHVRWVMWCKQGAI